MFHYLQPKQTAALEIGTKANDMEKDFIFVERNDPFSQTVRSPYPAWN